MSEFDVVLRESLGRLAEPGDPTGVADAVRARVGAAGAGGEAPPGAGPAGGGGSAGAGGAAGGAGATGAGFWGGWAPLGILIGLSVAGGAGLALAQEPDPLAADATVPLEISLPESVPGAACPGGGAVAQLDAGARVLAVFRSEDGAFLAVRNPAALPTTVWISADSAVVDSGQDVNALPVSDCVEGAEFVAEPSPVPSETAPAPAETTEAPDNGGDDNPPPPPPPDTTKPSITPGQFSPSTIDGYPVECADPNTTTINVTVTDNVGVASVVAADSYAGVTVALQSQSGSTWTFVATGNGDGPIGNTVTVTFTATDSAGNTAQAARQFTFVSCVF